VADATRWDEELRSGDVDRVLLGRIFPAQDTKSWERVSTQLRGEHDDTQDSEALSQDLGASSRNDLEDEDCDDETREQTRYAAARIAFVAETDMDLALSALSIQHISELAVRHRHGFAADTNSGVASQQKYPGRCSHIAAAGSSQSFDDFSLNPRTPAQHAQRVLLRSTTSIANIDLLLADPTCTLSQVMVLNGSLQAGNRTWRELVVPGEGEWGEREEVEEGGGHGDGQSRRTARGKRSEEMCMKMAGRVLGQLGGVWWMRRCVCLSVRARAYVYLHLFVSKCIFERMCVYTVVSRERVYLCLVYVCGLL